MDRKHPSNSDLGELLLLVLDGKIAEEEFKILQDKIIHDPAAREYYYEFITTYVGFSSYGNSGMPLFRPEDTAEDYSGLLLKLGEEEAISPSIPVLKPVAEDAAKSVVETPKIPAARKISRSSIISIFSAAAAVLFFVLFARFVPVPTRVEVATLKDSIGTKWADIDMQMRNGTRLFADKTPLLLREGIAQLQFDTKARLVVEAPAEFEILSEKEIRLRYGKVYAVVPHEAGGFTVDTQTTRVIDLGTEFGVQADISGDAFLHVIQGRTFLIAGPRADQKMEVAQGAAKRVSGVSSVISDISCNEQLFVRAIDSNRNVIWRGQSRLSLVDIAGGGDGFGKGVLDMGIDLKTGKLVAGNSERRGNDSKEYVLTPDLPFVDGVFVPDGGQGPVQLTSQGHIYKDFKDTNGFYYMAIGLYKTVDMFNNIKKEWQYDKPVTLAGYVRENSENLFVHPNAGITFDMQKIRQAVPFLKITRFTSVYGVSKTKDLTRTVLSDFYVFVDGQLRFEKTDVSVEDAPADISIPLEDKDRFLTLVCTQGSDGNYADWTLFVAPALELESTD